MSNHNQKHLSLSDRITIQSGITNSSTLKAIADTLGKDPTTIKKEIIRHRSFKPGSHFGESPSFSCLNSSSCLNPNKDIASFCNSSCSNFQRTFCKHRDSSPFACNGCSNSHCRKDKFLYNAENAQKDYLDTLSDSRSGIDLTSSEAQRLSDIVSPLIKNGHSPAQVIMNHPELNISEKTLYNYINDGVFPDLKNLDLRKKVSYKPRKSKNHPTSIDRDYLKGRTYKDFIYYLDTNPLTHVTELDSVEGAREGDGKVLHTMLFINEQFLIAYLADANTADSTVEWFDSLQKKLNTMNFIKFFPLILTDRGSEFSSPDRLEVDSNGTCRSHVFYCDAMHSWDKGALENAHHYIRYFLPKGVMFNDLTQDKVDLMISHINSSPRESLNGKTPYEIMEFYYGASFMNKLNIHKIDKDSVILTPDLLK